MWKRQKGKKWCRKSEEKQHMIQTPTHWEVKASFIVSRHRHLFLILDKGNVNLPSSKLFSPLNWSWLILSSRFFFHPGTKANHFPPHAIVFSHRIEADYFPLQECSFFFFLSLFCLRIEANWFPPHAIFFYLSQSRLFSSTSIFFSFFLPWNQNR